MKFNSQIVTTMEQSERLIALGLKKETADMCWTKMARRSGTYYMPELAPINMVSWRHTPAWPLHRLIEMMPKYLHFDEYADTRYYLTINPYKVIYLDTYSKWVYLCDCGSLYDKIISCIEWLIKEGHFPKEYLV